jgi:arabinose-5-phosphate isomerase
VRKQDSELAKASTIPLIIPAVKEANNVNAPTTSTTMMLALGDCLAVSLIDARGFNSENFGTFHPGGKLGSAFLKVADIMRKDSQIPIVKFNTKMSEVIIEMTSKHLGCTAVVDNENKMIGIITDGDLRRHLNQNFFSEIAENIMTKNPITILKESLAIEAFALMNKKSITSIFVLENNKIIGVLHLHDCLKAGV